MKNRISFIAAFGAISFLFYEVILNSRYIFPFTGHLGVRCKFHKSMYLHLYIIQHKNKTKKVRVHKHIYLYSINISDYSYPS